MIQKAIKILVNKQIQCFSYSKQSSFARMSAFRNDFDEKIKQKYIKNKTNDERFQQMNPEYIKKAINEEYEEAKEELFQNGGILTELRKSMLGKEEDEKETLGAEEFEDPVDNYLHDGLTHDEFLYRASNIKKQLFAKQIPDFFEKDEINSQYGNYSSFDKNFAKLKSMKTHLPDIEQSGFAGYKLEKWVNSLKGKKEIDDDEDLDEVREIIEENEINITEDEKHLLKWKIADIMRKENDEYVPFLEELEGENEKDPFEEDDTEDGRLSCKARDDIYELYQKGWSIKDICTRYGIVPERAKAVIWMCEKYYFQILPKADALAIHMAQEMEEEWEEENGWQDYGIDLEELAEREKGMHTLSFKRYREVDVGKPSKNILSEEDYTLVQKINTPRQEKITLKLDGGKYQRGYLIKDWKINKGRGRRDVSKMFRRIIENSHDISKLPSSVQLRVREGPRNASKGYSSKL
ncbi:hypothetical protein TTHERM_00046550 (macronuclear) [Tetrahymena thermophila SB210]|uniref:Uncharacterized protein n=1 Tax=Tetrahymena thermophila (strain SB210) TaxID=312017 RepID=Q23DN6_TETTS|nr:hypothetical protein TTHERM_00046550 [Tetrahymena thermophila SB210]EAR94450.1 hypothetical protein TTHERM_00046550 [Tetrahymena thermophila SB210]6Z1P_BE Chain BE, mS45 [Tetrahymena thermophila SB210]|eukprot:XP_001014650.1 hypothetical protein TTHERM_00046550 [Tetrahymena thermophila SB210]